MGQKIGRTEENSKKRENSREDILLSVRNLSVSFPSDRKKEAVRQVNFEIRRGGAVAVVGASGSGKTTLMRACMGLLGADASVDGEVIARFSSMEQERNLLKMERREKRKTIYGRGMTMVFQDPSVCLNPAIRIGNQIAEGLLVKNSCSRKDAKKRAEELLLDAGFEEAKEILRLYPHQLSGGMRQRIALILALICEPQLLIMDEPSSSLDAPTKHRILEMVEREREKRSMAVIYVTHDLSLAAEQADYIAVMHEGKIIESGTPKEIFQSPKEEYTKNLLKAAGKIAGIEGSEETFRRLRRPLLQVKNLKQYFESGKEGSIKAVDGVSFSIYPGEIYGLIGQSGSGKSTIGRSLMHIYEPFSGTMSFDGNDYSGTLSREKKRELYRGMQMIFQDPAACLNPARRVIDLVAQAVDIEKRKIGKDERKRLVSKALSEVGLSDELLYRYPHQLSGGQRQRVGIARTMITGPKLVIVDEAVSALDPLLQLQIAAMLKQFCEQKGMALLFISHDIRVVRHICDRVGIMYEGKLIEEGRTEEVFACPVHEYTRKLLFEA